MRVRACVGSCVRARGCVCVCVCVRVRGVVNIVFNVRVCWLVFGDASAI